jgi:general secretion pathway protein G
MEFKRNHLGFTMIELIMVIVIIGILSAVAIPKLAMTRDDAIISKATSIISSVRSALATEKQRRVLSGNFTPITTLSSETGYNEVIFDAFNGDTDKPVLEYPLQSCLDRDAEGCWIDNGRSSYTYIMPSTQTEVDFVVANNKFNCDDPSQDECATLTR